VHPLPAGLPAAEPMLAADSLAAAAFGGS